MKQLILPLFLAVICLFSCKEKPQAIVETPTTPVESENMALFPLYSGDLLFQDSDCGPFCESIEKVTFGYQGAKFSHVGMVVKTTDNKINIIEAISSGVVLTPLDTFLNRSFDSEGNYKVMVGRINDKMDTLIPDAVRFAVNAEGKAYDEVFDMTNDKYYCSELIYDAFRHANNGAPIFRLFPMTYKDPETKTTFPIWADYFNDLNIPIPEGQPGLNPGGLSKSRYIDIVHVYGNPDGYKPKEVKPELDHSNHNH